MPRNGAGTYTLPQPAFVPNTTISSSAVNSDFSDIAAALTTSISSDGQTPIVGPLKFSAGSSTAPSITFTTDTTTGLYLQSSGILGFASLGVTPLVIDANRIGTGGGNVLRTDYGSGSCAINPVGMVIDFAGSTPPTGWWLCYGQAISRTGYPELFSVIGTIYGAGDGSTTFNLPDLRGRATFGVDNMGGTAAGNISAAGDNFNGTILGNSGGFQNQTLGVANLAAHSHTVTATFSDPGHSHLISDPGHAHGPGSDTYFLNTQSPFNRLAVGTSGANPLNSSGSLTTATATTGITQTQIASTGIIGTSTSTQNTGSGASFSILPPAFILNKIIFAGRP